MLSLSPSPHGRTCTRVRRWPFSPEDLFMLCRVTLILKLWLRDLNLDSPASSHAMELKCIPQGLTFFPGLSEAWLSSHVWGSLQLTVLEKLLVEVSLLPLR